MKDFVTKHVNRVIPLQFFQGLWSFNIEESLSLLVGSGCPRCQRDKGLFTNYVYKKSGVGSPKTLQAKSEAFEITELTKVDL